MRTDPTAEILLLQPIAEAGMALLERIATVHHIWRSEDPAVEFAARATTARAVLTGAGSGIAREQIAAMPKLDIISLYGVGLDAVDLDLCRRRGIRVTNTPDVLTDDVADMALGLMLAVFRDIPQGDRFVRQGRWEAGDQMPLSRRMSGAKLGILGLGRIGGAIAKRAAAFDVEIAYTNRNRRPEPGFGSSPIRSAWPNGATC